MTTDIRQANKLTSYSATNLVFETTDPSTGATNNLTLNYNEAAGTLTRTYLDQTNTLLNEIKTNSFQFSIFQRNVSPGALSNIITGDARANRLEGGPTFDIITSVDGIGGNDVIIGHSGAGTDVCQGDAGPPPDSVSCG